jgi:ketosteroid isomerase-like protein
MTLPSSAGAATPREIVERMLRATLAGAWDDFADLYAPDVVIEWPFAPTGTPGRSVGRDQLRARLQGAAGTREFEKADPVVVYETTDPEVIIAEYDLHGKTMPAGRAFVSSYIMVMTVRDGLIVHSRDYSSPIAGERKA